MNSFPILVIFFFLILILEVNTTAPTTEIVLTTLPPNTTIAESLTGTVSTVKAATSRGSTVATCADTDSRCGNWVQNGFCSSTFYSSATKKAFCARTCSLCNVNLNSNCTGCTDNPGCAKWNDNGFCQSSIYTNTQKQQLCPNACCLCISGE